MWNDTSFTATTGDGFASNTVRKFSTLSSGSTRHSLATDQLNCQLQTPTLNCRLSTADSIKAHLAVFAEHTTQRIRNLADGGVRVDRGDNRRDEVVGARGGTSHRIERRLPSSVNASLPHVLHTSYLLRLEIRIDL